MFLVSENSFESAGYRIDELNKIVDMYSFNICIRVMNLPFWKSYSLSALPMCPVGPPDRARKIVPPEKRILEAAKAHVWCFLTPRGAPEVAIELC